MQTGPRYPPRDEEYEEEEEEEYHQGEEEYHQDVIEERGYHPSKKDMQGVKEGTRSDEGGGQHLKGPGSAEMGKLAVNNDTDEREVRGEKVLKTPVSTVFKVPDIFSDVSSSTGSGCGEDVCNLSRDARSNLSRDARSNLSRDALSNKSRDSHHSISSRVSRSSDTSSDNVNIIVPEVCSLFLISFNYLCLT